MKVGRTYCVTHRIHQPVSQVSGNPEEQTHTDGAFRAGGSLKDDMGARGWHGFCYLQPTVTQDRSIIEHFQDSILTQVLHYVGKT